MTTTKRLARPVLMLAAAALALAGLGATTHAHSDAARRSQYPSPTVVASE